MDEISNAVEDSTIAICDASIRISCLAANCLHHTVPILTATKGEKDEISDAVGCLIRLVLLEFGSWRTGFWWG